MAKRKVCEDSTRWGADKGCVGFGPVLSSRLTIRQLAPGGCKAIEKRPRVCKSDRPGMRQPRGEGLSVAGLRACQQGIEQRPPDFPCMPPRQLHSLLDRQNLGKQSA